MNVVKMLKTGIKNTEGKNFIYKKNYIAKTLKNKSDPTENTDVISQSQK